MKTLVICGVLLLSACATPRPVIDTATLVARMSGLMDRSITDYVESLNAIRDADSRRLQELRTDADRHRRPIQDQLQIMTLAEETRTLKVFNDVALVPDADPLGVAAGAPEITSSTVSFDTEPLKAVTKISSSIAKPRSAGEQLAVLLRFTNTVNKDLLDAAAGNKKANP